MSEKQPVKLYVGPDYKEPKLYTHSELMFPFWGVAAKESMPYVRAASLQYQYSKDDFVLVSNIEDADYVVMPYNYERLLKVNPRKVEKIINDAQHVGKPLLIDGSGDIERPIPIPNAVLLRVSQYRYTAKSYEITIPFVAEDLEESYGPRAIREKQEQATVGFAGWASISLKDRLKTYYKEAPLLLASVLDHKRFAEHKGLFFRERALEILSKNKKIKKNFTARPAYSGHIATISGSVEDTRSQFVNTFRDSDYALCVKGDANSSVRFYEALSLGCIPLFVNTECVLPLEKAIDYQEFCVFVDFRQLDKIDDILLEFHAKCSPEQFVTMQKKARVAYREYLRQDAFSKYLAADLRQRLIA